MWINKIEIEKFRAFQNPLSIEFAQRITCIAGRNGTGKSTLLAILSNCGELDRKNGVHLNGTPFKGEFAELVIGDPHYDNQKGMMIKIAFSDASLDNDYIDELSFRATFQKRSGKAYKSFSESKLDVEDKKEYENQEKINNNKRFRLLPKKTDDRKSEAKLVWPTYYLGLSRLYPVGETEKQKTGKLKLDEEVKKVLVREHANILSLQYPDDAYMQTINVSEVKKAKSGIKTDNYGPTANSSGQDNLGQILLTILSFQELKKNNPNYHSGILLIDELDATLHPAAQIKLFDYLYDQSVLLNLQVVFTTHSLSLLKHIDTDYKNTKDVTVIYLMNRSGEIDQEMEPSIDFMDRELNDIYINRKKPKKSVKIITEDKVSRWFIANLKSICSINVDICLIDMNLGWRSIVNLFKSDTSVYKTAIAILDPDINKDEKSYIQEEFRGTSIQVNLEFKGYSNILFLPSNVENSNDTCNIEKMLWLYLNSLNATHRFFKRREVRIDHNFHKDFVEKQGPFSLKYEKSKEAKKYKEWFKDNQEVLTFLLEYWVEDNKEIIDKFVKKFQETCNYFYKQLNIVG